MQLPFCDGFAVRAGHRRTLGDDVIDLSNPTVQNFVHCLASHPVQPEIAGIQNAFAVRFDEEQIAVRSGVVNAKRRDLNVANQKRYACGKGADGLDSLAERIILLPTMHAGQAHNVLCQCTGIERDLRADAKHLPGMVAVVMGKQHRVAASVRVGHTRNMQRRGHKARIKGQLIAHVDENTCFFCGNLGGDSADLVCAAMDAELPSASSSQTSPYRMEMP